MEKSAFCTLNRIFGFEPRSGHALVEAAGSASALFDMSGEELTALMGPYSKFSGRICKKELEDSARELQGLENRGYRFITASDKTYPALLRDCPDAPLGLYVRADSPLEEIFGDRPAISVVGTRDMSMYGREWCRRIVGALASCRRQPVIVSGLAYGIDITAHAMALEAGIPTIAVLPTYITEVYPLRHRGWASRIAETAGCALVSDYPPDTVPQRVNFLRRNRIIAGMSQATVLVESKAKGGGLITANLAFEYSREVYALPGRADDIRSQGCNRLIRAKVAEPVDDLDAFVAAVGLGIFTRRSRIQIGEEMDRLYSGRLDDGELRMMKEIAAHIKKERGIAVDDLCALCGCSWAETSRLTGMLEMDGVIERDMFQRCSMKFRYQG